MGRAFLAIAVASVLAFAPAMSRADASSEAAAARGELDATMTDMRARSRRVRDMLHDARRRRLEAQIACVDGALSRSDAALRRAIELADAALAAYDRGDLDYARSSRHAVGEWREAQRSAALDGQACFN